MNRYDVTNNEGDLQPGGESGVLRNKLGLTRVREIDAAETELLEALYLNVLEQNWTELNFDHIKHWHHQWLGNLYDWAGSLRTINMSKDGFLFAAADQLPRLIQEFEAHYLSQYPKLSAMDDETIVSYLAQSHVEFILIHPFREGNGRLSRLLLNVMAVEAGFEPLDYQLWEKHREFYFRSIQAGASGECQYMEKLVRDTLESN